MGRRNALWLWLAVSSALAMWVDFSHIHDRIQADTLIPVMCSLQKWTPFFWGQNRYGMLVPLLAWPVRWPMGNLLLQEGIDSFAGIVTFFLAARYLLPRATWPIAATLAVSVFLACAPPDVRYDLLSGAQPYGVSLALGIGSLLALEHAPPSERSWRVPLAVVLAVLAYWVNSTLATWLLPLLFGRQAIARGDRYAFTLSLSLHVIAQVASLALLAAYPDGNSYFEHVPIASWPSAWSEVLRVAARSWTGTAWIPALATMVILGVALQLGSRARDTRRSTMIVAMVLLGTAALQVLVVGANEWARLNAYATRYLVPAFVMVSLGIAASCDVALGRWLVDARQQVAFAAVLLLLSAVTGLGWPALGNPARDIASRTSPVAPLFAEAGCNEIAGDYWRAWPLAFAMGEAFHDRAPHRVAYSLAVRGEVLGPERDHIPMGERVLCATDLDATFLHDALPILGPDPRVDHVPGGWVAHAVEY